MTSRPAFGVKRFLLAACVMTCAGIGGLGIGSALAAGDGAAHPAPVTTNSRGQTVGEIDGLPPAEYPDLVKVTATNGMTGYVDSALVNELTGANVKTPEEALAWNRQMQAATWDTKEIPVFEADGVTQIGVFVISRSRPMSGMTS